jgi:hypothetical protein
LVFLTLTASPFADLAGATFATVGLAPFFATTFGLVLTTGFLTAGFASAGFAGATFFAAGALTGLAATVAGD